MKLKSKSSKKKITLLVISIVVVLGLAAGAYAIYLNQTTNQPASDTTDFQDVNPLDAPNQDKQQSYEEQKKEEASTPDSNDSQDNALTVTFTSVAQIDSTARVRITIDTLVEGGTCTLILTKGDTTVTKTAATYPTANTSTCQGFDIPVSELSSGEWKLHLNVTKDNRSGQAETTLNIS